MLFYVAFILATIFAAVAGLQYFYLIFLEARNRQQQKRIAELERERAELERSLRDAKALVGGEGAPRSEQWPEVVDDGGDYSLS